MPFVAPQALTLAMLFGQINKAASHIDFILSNYGIIKVSGRDASKLLQGQCTINVLTVSENQAKLSAICNIQGRVISLFYLIHTNEQFLLIMSLDLITPTITVLKKYAVFFQVSISDVSTEYKLVGTFNQEPQKEPFQAPNQYNLNAHLSYKINTKSLPLISDQCLTNQDWHKLLLVHHHPHLTLARIGQWLPQELGLLALEALDFEKGCYIGQEIIARMHYRSKRHFLIAVALISGNLNDDDSEVWDSNQKNVGNVIDSVGLSEDNYLALLSIKDGVYSAPLFLSLKERYHIELIANTLEK